MNDKIPFYAVMEAYGSLLDAGAQPNAPVDTEAVLDTTYDILKEAALGDGVDEAVFLQDQQAARTFVTECAARGMSLRQTVERAASRADVI